MEKVTGKITRAWGTRDTRETRRVIVTVGSDAGSGLGATGATKVLVDIINRDFHNLRLELSLESATELAERLRAAHKEVSG